MTLDKIKTGASVKSEPVRMNRSELVYINDGNRGRLCSLPYEVVEKSLYDGVLSQGEIDLIVFVMAFCQGLDLEALAVIVSDEKLAGLRNLCDSQR